MPSLPNSLLGMQSKAVIAVLAVVVLIITHLSVAYLSYNYGTSSIKKEELSNAVEALKNNQQELIGQQEMFNQNVSELNKKLETHSKTVKIITNNTEIEIEKPVYRDTIVPSSGMQLLANNATTLNAKRIPDSGIGKVQTDASPTEK